MMSSPSLSGFEIYLSQLEQCCKSKLSLPSLFMALPLPDIGGSTEFSGTHEKMYVRWAEKYCKFEASYARSLYHIRCDLLHSFGSMPKGAQRKRFIFTFPEFPGQFRAHSISLQSGDQNAIALDSILLSEHILNAAKAWYSAVQPDVDKQFRIRQMLRIYPNGIAPFIVGQPVIGFGHQN
jgi:hypothetical protein